MEVCGQLHGPATFDLWGVSTDFEVGWVPQLVWLLWTREKSLALPVNEQQLPDQSVNSLITVPVTLTQTLSSIKCPDTVSMKSEDFTKFKLKTSYNRCLDVHTFQYPVLVSVANT
jgi:hypothetical protein